jgi:hypothetical protein
MPTLSIPQPRHYLLDLPLTSDSMSRPPLYGSAGQELIRSEAKIREYWNKSCEQIHILREAHEAFRYQAMPPKKTFMVPIRYYLRGQGEPLPYQIDDK